MTAKTHRVILTSEKQFSGKMPPRELGYFLAELPDAVRSAVSMRLRNRSSIKGRQPAWLERAADIRLVDYEGSDDTTLFFEAISLGESAQELYRQNEFWPSRPESADTGLDLLGDVLVDIETGNADSDRFDTQLLRRLTRFKRSLAGPFQEVRFEGCRRALQNPPRLSSLLIQTAERLSSETPPPRTVRVAGVLDMVRASNQTLALRMADGSEVRGSLVEGKIEDLASLINDPVLLFGKALFRPSGRLLRLDVKEFRRATEADEFFAKVPKPRARARLASEGYRTNTEALRNAFGKWPGDETDEEIAAALEELR